ncbi:hypothetical protein [Butyrivibrio sp. MC2021]|uniref:hypothetical protein n=1 Tax=Butyrivibrio sp. MC2021 TaxID=1408306 RepID=UPI00047985D9|nr:hypothetical protein [Butyrivibrio sp. MC2021]
MNTFLKIIKFALLLAAVILILTGIMYLYTGSLELNPTEEQQGKAAIEAFLMIVGGAAAGGIGMMIGRKK